MGCDIHMMAQKRSDDGSYHEIDFVPFDWRSYGVFGFLADVRNYSAVTPVSTPRGIPDDMKVKEEPTEWWDKGYEPEWESCDYHSHSWLSVKELADIDYDQIIEDRRYNGMTQYGYISGALTSEPGKGQMMKLRDFLGEQFIDDLERLKYEEVDRIVFWFDN